MVRGLRARARLPRLSSLARVTGKVRVTERALKIATSPGAGLATKNPVKSWCREQADPHLTFSLLNTRGGFFPLGVSLHAQSRKKGS